MPLSPEIDNQIRQRLAELEVEANRLVELQDDRSVMLGREGSRYTSDYHRLKTSFLNLIQMLATKK